MRSSQEQSYAAQVIWGSYNAHSNSTDKLKCQKQFKFSVLLIYLFIYSSKLYHMRIYVTWSTNLMGSKQQKPSVVDTVIGLVDGLLPSISSSLLPQSTSLPSYSRMSGFLAILTYQDQFSHTLSLHGSPDAPDFQGSQCYRICSLNLNVIACTYPLHL